MANTFPYTSTASPSGRTGEVFVNTGGEAIGQATSQLGQTVLGLGLQYQQKQGEVELYDAKSADQKDIAEMYAKLEKTTNANDYDAIFNDTWGRIQGREVKNGWARRKRSLTMPGLKTYQEALVGRAKEKRIDDNREFQLQLELQKFVNGEPNTYEAMLSNDSQVSKEQRELDLRGASRLRERRQIELIAQSNDFQDILDLDTAADMIKKYPLQIPGDFRYFQGLAITQASAKGKEQLAMGEDVYADIKLHQATGGKQGKKWSPTELAQMLKGNQITKSAHDSALDAITKPPARDIRRSAKAYLAITRGLAQYKAGLRTEKDFGDLVNSHQNLMTEADFKSFTKARQAAEDKITTSLMKSATQTAEDVFTGKNQVVSPYEADEAVILQAEAHKQLLDWMETSQWGESGKALDSKSFNEAAIDIVLRINNNAERFLETPKAASRTVSKTKASNTVRVKSPDGRIGTIKRSELKEALANGWTEIAR